MERLKIIGEDQRDDWNDIVKSFANWDVYYLWEYVYALFLHGDGKPKLIYYESDKTRICYVVMENDIADESFFAKYIDTETHLDWTTPYGYGGPLTEGEISEEWMRQFVNELTGYAVKHTVVSQFLRFHPMLQNQKEIEAVMDVVYLKKTVYMDTSSEDMIFQNMTSKSRNMVRKAQKNQVRIIADHGERIEDFKRVYKATMDKHQADTYYYFDESYYDILVRKMNENLIFFYAEYEEQIVSASIFLYNENYMHYHLSGTLPDYRHLAAANLLLDEAAKWAAGMGIAKLHLGGGVENSDSLLAFKKQFNRNGELDFCIGRSIFIPEKFEQLVKLRTEKDKSFNAERPFLIKYRG